jgi:hypothetical protein
LICVGLLTSLRDAIRNGQTIVAPLSNAAATPEQRVRGRAMRDGFMTEFDPPMAAKNL